MAEFLRIQYEMGRITEETVHSLLRRGKITQADYHRIIEGGN